MAEDETNELLREVVYLLRIIARPELTQLRDRFEASLLTSQKRRRMWDEMDGSRTLADIAKVAGTSSEAVRLFVKDIEENFPDLIEVGDYVPQRPRSRLI